jgi:hypothetical protein
VHCGILKSSGALYPCDTLPRDSGDKSIDEEKEVDAKSMPAECSAGLQSKLGPRNERI